MARKAKATGKRKRAQEENEDEEEEEEEEREQNVDSGIESEDGGEDGDENDGKIRRKRQEKSRPKKVSSSKSSTTRKKSTKKNSGKKTKKEEEEEEDEDNEGNHGESSGDSGNESEGGVDEDDDIDEDDGKPKRKRQAKPRQSKATSSKSSSAQKKTAKKNTGKGKMAKKGADEDEEDEEEDSEGNDGGEGRDSCNDSHGGVDEDDDNDEDDGKSKRKRQAKPRQKKASSSKSSSAQKKTVKKNTGKGKMSKKDVEEEEEESEGNDDDEGGESGHESEGGDENDGDDNDEDDDNDGDDNDEDDGKSKRKRQAKPRPKKASSSTSSSAPKKAAAKKSSNSKSSSEAANGDVKEKKNKQLRKYERLEEARKAYKWWEAPDLPSGINWRSLEHPAIYFPKEYVPHNIPILYDGKPVRLTSEQEEIASFYAAMPLDGPQLGNPKTSAVFQANFFDDFKVALGPTHVIKKFEKCNFDDIRQHLDLQKSLKKTASDEAKQVVKLEKEQILLKYGYALIDGRIEKMGNFNMEPPGLFRGRGEHPKTGKLKKRCYAESVHLNLSEDACVPICPTPGHAWGSVRHDPAVTWLCSWNENVQNQCKYVMLAASSSFKGKSDMDKYSKAIKLKACIHKVRSDYAKKIQQKTDRSDRQLGVAMWVIDVLALRVGGEKGEDEADTVGCCSLRVEHLTFNPDEASYEIELEFLGKDSMLYKQNINFATHGELGKMVYNCLKSFCAKKSPEDDVFETLQPAILNKHLSSLMKGLTAKVFRTYNASVTLEKELPSAEELEGLSVADKVLRYNAANREVAILCNHQKTVSKATEAMFENLNEKLATFKQQRQELVAWKELLQKKKGAQIPLKAEDKETTEEIKARMEDATKERDAATSNEKKLAAAAKIEAAKADLKLEQKKRFMEKHKYSATPSLQSLEARIEKWADDIRKMEVDIRNRDENKEVALGTSKINYMDPRISVAWCKRCEVPIDKIFAKTLRDKFNWAMAVPPDWKFE